jgi:hypothetical protein
VCSGGAARRALAIEPANALIVERWRPLTTPPLVGPR